MNVILIQPLFQIKCLVLLYNCISKQNPTRNVFASWPSLPAVPLGCCLSHCDIALIYSNNDCMLFYSTGVLYSSISLFISDHFVSSFLTLRLPLEEIQEFLHVFVLLFLWHKLSGNRLQIKGNGFLILIL